MTIFILCIYILCHSRLCGTQFLGTRILHSLVGILYELFCLYSVLIIVSVWWLTKLNLTSQRSVGADAQKCCLSSQFDFVGIVTEYD